VHAEVQVPRPLSRCYDTGSTARRVKEYGGNRGRAIRYFCSYNRVLMSSSSSYGVQWRPSPARSEVADVGGGAGRLHARGPARDARTTRMGPTPGLPWTSPERVPGRQAQRAGRARFFSLRGAGLQGARPAISTPAPPFRHHACHSPFDPHGPTEGQPPSPSRMLVHGASRSLDHTLPPKRSQWAFPIWRFPVASAVLAIAALGAVSWYAFTAGADAAWGLPAAGQTPEAPTPALHDALASAAGCSGGAGCHVDAAGAQAVVAELATLARCGKSPRGKKYRSLICTAVRNDAHMREFVVRNLLLGFCHVVVLDNNRVGLGRDHNISMLLAPFVQAGLVTHVAHVPDGNAALPSMAKDDAMRACLLEYGSSMDWAISMDADEVIAFADGGNSTSVGALDRFLTDVENSTAPICALHLPWQMMYGEHRVLKHEGALLMDEFPRILAQHQLPKCCTGRI